MGSTEAEQPIGLPEGSAAAIAALSLSACGGEDGSTSRPSSGSSPTAAGPVLSLPEAARFLAQATNGTEFGTIEEVSNSGVESWVNRQFAKSRSRSFWTWLEANGFADPERLFAQADWEIALWHGLLHDNDHLRQRITLALLDIFVVGIGNLHPGWRSFSMANYLDILADNSFGNYRTLIEEITYSTAMGDWLTYTGSRKANGQGSLPDENYARELMQLFSLGLHRLNEDGTPQIGGDGQPVATYNQTDVSELARVFTGFVPSDPDFNNRNRNHDRLAIYEPYNDTGDKVVLGRAIRGGGYDAVSQALDIVFEHPNLPPFFSRQLILRLVTSNPSPAYVQRVARVFADNGSGKRGDLKAVLRAIFLDREARQAPSATSGRLREPAQRLLNWARAFKVKPKADELAGPYLQGSLLKSPGWSPTVFNFFDADYSPPLTDIQAQGLAAPGFQIASEQTVIAYITFINNAVQGNWASRGLEPKFDNFLSLADDPASLVNRLNLVFAAGQLSPAISNEITAQVSAISAPDDAGRERRVKLAALLTLASPDYLVQA